MVCAGVGVWLRGWYDARYLWPSRIQRELLGYEIADPAALRTRESHGAYGQGMFRWRYRAMPTANLSKVCGDRTPAACKFIRTRAIGNGVNVTIFVEDGTIELTEFWS